MTNPSLLYLMTTQWVLNGDFYYYTTSTMVYLILVVKYICHIIILFELLSSWILFLYKIGGLNIDRVMHEYEIGCEIRNKLVPNAVEWYTGKAVASEDKEGPAIDPVSFKF